MKAKVAVMGSPVPSKSHGFCGRKATLIQSISCNASAQELCKGSGGRPELSVPNNLYGLCGRKVTMNTATSACRPAAHIRTLISCDCSFMLFCASKIKLIPRRLLKHNKQKVHHCQMLDTREYVSVTYQVRGRPHQK